VPRLVLPRAFFLLDGIIDRDREKRASVLDGCSTAWGYQEGCSRRKGEERDGQPNRAKKRDHSDAILPDSLPRRVVARGLKLREMHELERFILGADSKRRAESTMLLHEKRVG